MFRRLAELLKGRSVATYPLGIAHCLSPRVLMHGKCHFGCLHENIMHPTKEVRTLRYTNESFLGKPRLHGRDCHKERFVVNRIHSRPPRNFERKNAMYVHPVKWIEHHTAVSRASL